MHQRYLLIVSTDRQDIIRIDDQADVTESFRADTDGLQIVCFSDKLISEPWFVIQREENDKITMTEGLVHAGESRRPIQPGTYNQISIDEQSATVILRNDVLAALPCYFAISGAYLAISNNLSLLQSYLHLPLDYSGLAQAYLLAGWRVDDRTIFEGARLAEAGSEYRFIWREGWQLGRKRVANSWTEVSTGHAKELLSRTCDLWNQAIARTSKAVGGPVGVMLSGGLDSRMVAAGLVQHGVPIFCLTHGNIQGDEAQIAQQVSRSLGAPWIANALDDSFPYEQLHIDRTFATLGALFNPIWDSSGAMLAKKGAVDFTSGAGLEGLLGGRTDSHPVRRFLKNLFAPAHSLKRVRPVTEVDIVKLARPYEAVAAMRRRNYTRLLAQPYRSMIEEYAEIIGIPIRAQLIRMAADGNPAPDQLAERFVYEQSEKQVMTLQELQLARYGVVHFPTYDLDFVEYVSNLPPAFKYDHHLYYQVINRLYPDMAALPVMNLGTRVDRSQISLEIIRAWRILNKKRLTTWVNFEEWIKGDGRLDQHINRFLANDHFFDPEQIARFFSEVREGRRRLYDGNETLSFLSLGMAIGAMN